MVYGNSETRALTNPFGIYIHVPFCKHKCSYCDFYSFTKYDEAFFVKLEKALLADLDLAVDWFQKNLSSLPVVSTIFFGGGTPSLFPVSMLKKILEAVRGRFEFEEATEITVEANPETVTLAWAEEVRRIVNRVSLGAQSFNENHLKTLERLGSRESIHEAVATLRKAGFQNYNLDLIFGIPEQTLSSMEEDLKEAISLSPKHISFYQLTLAKGHPLYSKLPGEDSGADFYEKGRSLLEEGGYGLYEISNFAKPGFECRHNLLYWAGGDFLGIGPSASSRVFKEGRFYHRKERSDFNHYVQERSAWEFEGTSKEQTVLEASFLELRNKWGVELNRFHARYGYDLSKAKRYSDFLSEGLLSEQNGSVTLTPRGRLLADWVSRELVD